jgi:hypothetical protein
MASDAVLLKDGESEFGASALGSGPAGIGGIDGIRCARGTRCGSKIEQVTQ